MENFKGKYVFYSNINGKEQKIEKDFNSQEDYDSFMKENKNLEFDSFFNRFNTFNFFPSISQDFLESFFSKKPSKTLEAPKNTIVDLESYKREIDKIEQEKKEKNNKKRDLEQAKKDLNDYLEIFKKEGKQDQVGRIQEDLKKVENELKGL